MKKTTHHTHQHQNQSIDKATLSAQTQADESLLAKASAAENLSKDHAGNKDTAKTQQTLHLKEETSSSTMHDAKTVHGQHSNTEHTEKLEGDHKPHVPINPDDAAIVAECRKSADQDKVNCLDGEGKSFVFTKYLQLPGHIDSGFPTGPIQFREIATFEPGYHFVKHEVAAPPPPPPIHIDCSEVSLTPTLIEGEEGGSFSGSFTLEGGRIPFNLTLDKASPVDIKIALSFGIDGDPTTADATPGLDYNNLQLFDIGGNPISGPGPTLTIPAGTTFLQFFVGTIDDSLVEFPENLLVRIDSAANVTPNPNCDSPDISAIHNEAVGTIFDNDQVVVSINTVLPGGEQLCAIEGDFQQFRLSLSQPSPVPIRVDLALAPDGNPSAIAGVDYVNGIFLSPSGADPNPDGFSITIPANATTFDFFVQTLSDQIVEPEEFYQAVITAVQNAVLTPILPPLIGIPAAEACIDDNTTVNWEIVGSSTVTETGTANYVLSHDATIGPGGSLSIELTWNLPGDFSVPNSASSADFSPGLTLQNILNPTLPAGVSLLVLDSRHVIVNFSDTAPNAVSFNVSPILDGITEPNELFDFTISLPSQGQIIIPTAQTEILDSTTARIFGSTVDPISANVDDGNPATTVGFEPTSGQRVFNFQLTLANPALIDQHIEVTLGAPGDSATAGLDYSNTQLSYFDPVLGTTVLATLLSPPGAQTQFEVIVRAGQSSLNLATLVNVDNTVDPPLESYTLTLNGSAPDQVGASIIPDPAAHIATGIIIDSSIRDVGVLKFNEVGFRDRPPAPPRPAAIQSLDSINKLAAVAPTFTVPDGQNYVELRNTSATQTISGSALNFLRMEIIGPSATKVTVDLNTLSGLPGTHDLAPNEMLVLFENGQWAIFNTAGGVKTFGTYTTPTWGFGHDTSDSLGLNLYAIDPVTGNPAFGVDLFLANQVASNLFQRFPTDWVGANTRSEAGVPGSSSFIAASFLGAVLASTFNNQVTGYDGDQTAVLNKLGIARPHIDGAPTSNGHDGTLYVFSRDFSTGDVDPSKGPIPTDTNQETDWTINNHSTIGQLNVITDINPQDPTDNLNPTQGAGTNVDSTTKTFSSSQTVIDASLLPAAADHIHLNGGAGPDYIYGDSHNNIISGGDSNDVLWGGPGNDHIEGGKGADLLIDVDGHDQLIGGNGDDILIANAALRPNSGVVIQNDSNDILIGDNIITGKLAQFNVVFVIDTSGSMALDFNGNSNPAAGHSRLDIVKAAFTSLIDDIRAQGIADNTQVLIVPFDGNFPLGGARSPATFLDANDPNIEAKINSLFASGNTQFEDPLSYVANWLQTDVSGTPRFQDHTNAIYFLSDGADNNGYQLNTPGLQPLYNGAITDLSIHAFGFGAPGTSNADPDQLDEVITGLPDHNGVADHAVIVTDPSQLTSALTAGSISGAPTGADVIFGGNFNDFIFGDNLVVTDLTTYNADPFGWINSHLVDTANPNYSEQLVTLENNSGGQNDWIDAGAGNDVVFGQGGDDTILGNDGNDTIHGGAGNDWISGGNGDDKIFGDNGNDHIFGNLGNDYIDGGKGNDDITGGQGNDTIIAGVVGHQHDGETDTIRYTSVLDGHDTITGFDNTNGPAGTTHDIINLSALFDSLGTAAGARAGLVHLTQANATTVQLTVTGVVGFAVDIVNSASNAVANFHVGSDPNANNIVVNG